MKFFLVFLMLAHLFSYAFGVTGNIYFHINSPNAEIADVIMASASLDFSDEPNEYEFFSKVLDKSNEMMANAVLYYDQASAAYLMGYAYSGLGKPAQALESYHTATSAFPDNVAYKLDYAVELFLTDQTAAMQLMDEVRLATENTRALTTLTQFYFINASYEKSQKLAEHVIQRSPEQSDILYASLFWMLNNAYLKNDSASFENLVSNRVKEAIWPVQMLQFFDGDVDTQSLLNSLQFVESHQKRSCYSEMLYYLGEAFLANGQKDEAMKCFQSVIGLNVPSSTDYIFSVYRLKQLS